MTPEDNWVTSAMNDINLVVHLLVKLRHTSPISPPKTWTIRQPRTKPSPHVAAAADDKSPTIRASPTTPLSWTSDGVEDSGRPPLHDGAASDVSRSKVIESNETTPTKRPRKKKTLAELRDDEMRLLKERKLLKQQLSSLQATCQKYRKDNESLKKMKDDMKSQMLASSEINNCTEEKKNDGFILPDLNIPAGDDY